ncbi:RimJ/RimL family protein N-acetyltransferase [Chitinophaga dinghuensis]|uniref:RimJ/RimL family protein N-acetyltransferase n=1 Tax=Chitinophaga dinghuensis TaxID=1539050 RepID=A0A327W125_9BACT|nr:GNAT family N-acetyltransferase [Chitinophaga dinghuensis]RAJ81946.1 RimJ/RimL family protein N-acetyltransferase [Chitinophaga dinghuensis]
MNLPVETNRLLLTALKTTDAPFILELLNTKGWKTFIGERYVRNLTDADTYITRILSNPDVRYFVVRLKSDNNPMGIVSLIQRPYLPHQDIGFAFLPQHSGSGYAFEAASEVIRLLTIASKHPILYATTLPENTRSIKLLEKLGLSFVHEFTRDTERLFLYQTILAPEDNIPQ